MTDKEIGIYLKNAGFVMTCIFGAVIIIGLNNPSICANGNCLLSEIFTKIYVLLLGISTEVMVVGILLETYVQEKK